MKKIEIMAYEIMDFFNDDGTVKKGFEKVVDDIVTQEINFYLQTDEGVFKDAIDRCEEMRTPWFLHSYIWDYHRDFIMDSLKNSDCLYDDMGTIIGRADNVTKISD